MFKTATVKLIKALIIIVTSTILFSLIYTTIAPPMINREISITRIDNIILVRLFIAQTSDSITPDNYEQKTTNLAPNLPYQSMQEAQHH